MHIVNVKSMSCRLHLVMHVYESYHLTYHSHFLVTLGVTFQMLLSQLLFK